MSPYIPERKLTLPISTLILQNIDRKDLDPPNLGEDQQPSAPVDLTVTVGCRGYSLCTVIVAF